MTEEKYIHDEDVYLYELWLLGWVEVNFDYNMMAWMILGDEAYTELLDGSEWNNIVAQVYFDWKKYKDRLKIL